jgi:hypothetical protein
VPLLRCKEGIRQPSLEKTNVKGGGNHRKNKVVFLLRKVEMGFDEEETKNNCYLCKTIIAEN